MSVATILVVDDSPHTRALLASLIVSAGHRVVEASDGAEGFGLARRELPDLVITDVLMPEMDGYEFLRRLRNEPATATTPVIFYTAAFIQDEVSTVADRWGLCWVLPKPSEPAQILRAMEVALKEPSQLPIPPPPDESSREHLAVLNRALMRQVRSLEAAQLERQRLVQDLHEANRQRRLLLARLVTAQEEEARRIAADIHDDSIQVMAVVNLRLGLLGRSLVDPAQLRTLDELQSVVKLSIAKLRRLLFELRPLALDQGGLAVALGERLEQAWREEGPAYEVHDGFPSEPGPEARVILYRVAQEALTNVERHAGASRVVINLEGSEGGFLIRIQDDGAGFDAGTSTGSPLGHMGLRAMRERAEMAGGWTRVSSSPGAGTTVECWVPADLPAPDAAGT